MEEKGRGGRWGGGSVERWQPVITQYDGLTTVRRCTDYFCIFYSLVFLYVYALYVGIFCAAYTITQYWGQTTAQHCTEYEDQTFSSPDLDITSLGTD